VASVFDLMMPIPLTIVEQVCPFVERPRGVVGAVKGELYLQAATGRCLEHRTLKYVGAVPAGGMRVVGKRQDDARGARHSLLAVFTKHAP
jgi:hypothetical protein